MAGAATAASESESGLITRLRLLLLAILALGMVGTGTELVLLEHMESRWQLVPLFALGYGLIACIAVAIRPARFTVRLLRVLMLVFIAAGLTGLYLHYSGNMEFELEMYPSMTGLELFWESVTGATPALAPGTMVQLGLLGLVFSFRHPALRGSTAQTTEKE